MSEGNKQSLVIMTNGDVYYVEREAAKTLMSYQATGKETPEFYLVTDQKSGAVVGIKTAHISSVVSKGAQNA